MKLTAKLSNGSTKDVELDSLDIQVDELKIILATCVDIPPENQRIVFRGKVLKPVDVLRNVGIEDGHAIHVVRSQAAPEPTTSKPATIPSASTSPTVIPQPVVAQQAENPYAALFGGVTAPQASNQASGGNAWAASGFGGTWQPSPQEAQQMMQNPFVAQMVQQMLQNPQLLQQITASNPMLQSLPPEVVRQSLTMMNNPQMMQQMSQMMNANASAPSQAPHNPFTGANLFTPPPVQNPREVYASQLDQLRAMGFPNEQANIAALQQSQGNIEFAIERLLGA
ncbi:ubiquitin-like protein, putative [Bodo saltans]|uniref:Ubiquitin-like protein, putative n=1 Tax=Bodo saltans TaxID=75058 RepID=A0A0S4JQ29_BODSA|nr:ubiquitin-like protein, putative [Bodo saltans]|eukprot:CUG91190.1 ubiquitin-like protein, putative [Bodo saltans]